MATSFSSMADSDARRVFAGDRHGRTPDPSNHGACEPSNGLITDSGAAHDGFPDRPLHARHSSGHRSEYARSAEHGRNADRRRHKHYDTQPDDWRR